MSIVEDFHKWLDEEDEGLLKETVVTRYAKISQSATASFATSKYDSDVSVWDNGLCDFVIADLEESDKTDDYLAEFKHYEFNEFSEMKVELEKFIERIKD